MKLFDLFATISLDGKSFMSGLKSASSSFGSFASTISTGVVKIESTVEASVKRIGVAMVGLGSTLAATGVKYNSMMENYTADFTTLLQDATKAQQKVEELRKLDLVSPLDMNTLAGATKTMLSFGVAEDEVGSKLTELTDISMGNAERMNSLALAYAQIRSVGKLTMIDLRQMANQGFNPLKVVAEKTGVAIGDLQDFMSYGKPSELMQEAIKAANEEIERLGANASEGAKMLAQMGEEGEISADIVSRAITIATSEGGQYFKAAENAAKTLTGQLSMLKGGVSKLIGSGFEPMSEALTEDILPYMNQLIEDLDEAFNRHGGGNEGLVGMLAVVRDELVKMRDESGEYTKEAEHRIVQGTFLAKNTLKVFNGMLPTFLETGESIFQKIREGIDTNLPELSTSAATLAEYLIPSIVTLKADLLTLGLEIIGGIADGINKDFSDEGEGKIRAALTGGIAKIAGWVSDEENGKNISNAAASLLTTFAGALIEKTPEILGGAITILGTTFTDIIGIALFGEKGWADQKAKIAAEASGISAQNLGEDLSALFPNAYAEDVAAVEAQFAAINDKYGITSSILTDVSGRTRRESNLKYQGLTDWFGSVDERRWEAEIRDQMDEAIENANLHAYEELAYKLSLLYQGYGEGFRDSELDAFVESALGRFDSILSGQDRVNGFRVRELTEDFEELNTTMDETIANMQEIDGSTLDIGMRFTVGGILNDNTASLAGGSKTLKGMHYTYGHATGLDYVPYDEYMARLHEGEAVLTKEEAKRWRRGEQDGGMMVVREEQSTRPIALYIDGQEVASVLYNQMNKRINNGNLQQIYGMGG